MKPTVNVCDGCCCGRVNKSNLAVPKDELKTLWREHDLSKHVNLRVTSCLGPCSRANVTLVSTAEAELGLAASPVKTTTRRWLIGHRVSLNKASTTRFRRACWP